MRPLDRPSRRTASTTSAAVGLLAGLSLSMIALASTDDTATKTAPPAPAAPTTPTATPDGTAAPTSLEIRIPNTTVSFRMVRVPDGTVPAPEGGVAEQVGPFWIGEAEVTWDEYDVFVYALDEPDADPVGKGAEATTRPSKPYVPPDRGFGHAGYPAMGMTHKAAERYCAWLSERTGRTFRLPTEAEWEHACRGGADGAFAGGRNASELDSIAWHARTAKRSTHPVRSLAPTGPGVYDIHGNVAEWTNGRDGRAVAKGGSYKDAPEGTAATERQRKRSSWNASDPQIPKSAWWLADCSFVGFRVVMEEEPAPAGE